MNSSRLLACDHPQSVLRAGHRATAYSVYGYRGLAVLPGVPGFNGELADPLSGHYLLGNGHRAYNPLLMRFNRPDSWSPFGRGGVNAYVYCLGDPVNRRDPSGHASRDNSGKGSDSTVMWLGIAMAVLGLGLAVGAGVRTLVQRRRSATTATPMGDFARFEGMPHVMDKIVRHLPGDDMVSLAATSRTMKQWVQSNVKPLPALPPADKLSKPLRNQLREIALGRAPGHPPGQVTGWSNILQMAATPLPASNLREQYKALMFRRKVNQRQQAVANVRRT